MRYIEVYFKEIPEGLIDSLIAVLPDFGFSGMEELSDGLKAYAPEQDANIEALTAIAESHSITYTSSLIEEKNWNEEWEANFTPVIIPGKIYVRAHFHEPIDNIEHEILITPKMSFGTGHHATTSMMMKAMLDLDINGLRVIDFGTGTGILAILAEKLGAKEIHAIDNDQWSINNAEENIVKNNATRIHIHLLDTLESLMPANLVLANINKSILLAHVNDIYKKLLPCGILIISGLLSVDYEDTVSVYQPFFGDPVRNFSENGWITLLFEKRL